MPRLLPLLVALLVVPIWLSPVTAAPTFTQLCESAMELGSAKYAQCRLTAQSKDAKAPNPAKLSDALGRCSQKLSDAFAKATLRYAGACPATEPSSAFDEYLKQCSDDTVAAVGGAALPDYVGDLASCNADLGTCNGDLATCNADLATTTADLATCEGDLSLCVAGQSARLLKTGQTTSYGAGSDGDLQVGVAQSYVDNGDGTITDTNTGLVWEKKSDDGSIHDKDNGYTWSGPSYGTTNVLDGTVATTFLAELNAGGGFAGHTDWRLPNRHELSSLVNLQNVAPAVSAAFNTNCGSDLITAGNPGCTVTTCSCTVAGMHWTSSTFAHSNPGPQGQYAWAVAFYVGNVWEVDKFNSVPARAVRGGS